ELGFDLFPRDAGFAGVAFDRSAQFHEIFHVFEPFLQPADFPGERFEGRFFEGGSITHRLPFGSSQRTRQGPKGPRVQGSKGPRVQGSKDPKSKERFGRLRSIWWGS